MDRSADEPAAVRPMTAQEFAGWREGTIAGYAAQRPKAHGTSVEEQMGRAASGFADLVPDGIDTPATMFLAVLDGDGARVGVLWLGPHPTKPDAWWVYEIEIAEEHQGRGFGRSAMLAAERMVAQAGGTEIGLNVFGFNTVARKLYGSLGYRDVSVEMSKTVTAP